MSLIRNDLHFLEIPRSIHTLTDPAATGSSSHRVLKSVECNNWVYWRPFSRPTEETPSEWFWLWYLSIHKDTDLSLLRYVKSYGVILS